MRGKVALQGLQLQWGRSWVFPLCCLVPLASVLVAVTLGLFPGWEYSLLLATCPLCHLLVIWFARHHLMHDEEPETLRQALSRSGVWPPPRGRHHTSGGRRRTEEGACWNGTPGSAN